MTKWIRKFIVTELSKRVFTDCTPTRPDCRNKMRDTGYNYYTSNQVTQEMHNYRVIQSFIKVSAIRQSGRVGVHSVNTRSDNSVTINFRIHFVISFFSFLCMRNPFLKFCSCVSIHPVYRHTLFESFSFQKCEYFMDIVRLK
jgi:hypothetical protein